MKMGLQKLLLCLVITHCVSAKENANNTGREIYIDAEHGSAEADCWKTKCSSLKMAAQAVVNSTTIIVLSPLLHLNDTVRFPPNCNHLILTSTTTSTLQCKRNETGLVFEQMKNLKIERLTISHCGFKCEGYKGEIPMVNVALLLRQCRNVYISSVVVKYSNGTGMLMESNSGVIDITDTTLFSNTVSDKRDMGLGGGGIHIDFYDSANTSYFIRNCTFLSNAVNYKADSITFVEGGGLSLFFNGNSSDNSVSVSQCNFTNNAAKWGGGLYSQFQNGASNNSVFVESSCFIKNDAATSGGGVNLGYFSSHSSKNTYTFKHVHFNSNSATYAGGTAIFAQHEHRLQYSTETDCAIRFIECIWKQNKAVFSAALDISPYVKDTYNVGTLPTPYFKDCLFLENEVKDREINSSSNKHYVNQGVFSATRFIVRFGGKLEFKYNARSALYLVSSVAIFETNTTVHFLGNYGLQGGGICMVGFSEIIVGDHCILKFTNNTALYHGAAIDYYSYNQLDFIASHSCFIKPSDNTTENITFHFDGNHAVSEMGNSIFATTLLPCYFYCINKLLFTLPKCESVEQWNSCLGQFNFYNNESGSQVSTDGGNIFAKSSTISAVPGIPFSANLQVKDDLCNVVHTTYSVTILDQSASLCDYNNIISNDTICVVGRPSTVVGIIFETILVRKISIDINVSLSNCHPGYVLDSNRRCECSALTKTENYRWIENCNGSQAILKRGVWAGYVGRQADLENLCTAQCPVGFCKFDEDISLPLSASKHELAEAVCVSGRKGKICAECKANLSARFHSERHDCGGNSSCRLGFLYFMLTEIFPATMFFVLVIAGNIKLTSGSVASFVFFTQLLFALDTSGGIDAPKQSHFLVDIYKIVYGVFSLRFLCIDKLSFCLWEGAGELDITAIKYVTTAYALALVIILLVVFKYCDPCNCALLCRLNICNERPHSYRHSTIHGLSAYLVVCYSQCTTVTMHILTPVQLYGKGGKPHGHLLSLYGGIPYFQAEHIKYAVPACIILVFVIILPLLLLFYPLHYKIIAMCRLDEFCLIKNLLLVINIKPFMDSFQGCFKDNCRFFAGLYFVYRLIPSILFAVFKYPLMWYSAMAAFLLLVLLVHAIVQPYAKRQHNIIDAAMIANLSLINGINFFIFLNSDDSLLLTYTNVLQWIQLVLIYLPSFYLTMYLSVKAYKKRKSAFKYTVISD